MAGVLVVVVIHEDAVHGVIRAALSCLLVESGSCSAFVLLGWVLGSHWFSFNSAPRLLFLHFSYLAFSAIIEMPAVLL